MSNEKEQRFERAFKQPWNRKSVLTEAFEQAQKTYPDAWIDTETQIAWKLVPIVDINPSARRLLGGQSIRVLQKLEPNLNNSTQWIATNVYEDFSILESEILGGRY